MPEIEKVVPTELDGNSRYAIRVRSVNSFGIPSDWSEALMLDTDEAGSPTGGRLALTANGLIAYDANGQTKMVYSGEDSAIRTNKVFNPSFEVNTSAWTALTNSTLTRTTADYYIGEPATLAAGQVTCTQNLATNIGFVTPAFYTMALFPGDEVTASAYVKAPIDAVSVKVGVRFYGAGDVLIKEVTSFSPRLVPVDGKWHRVSSVAALAPNGTQTAGFVIYSTSAMANGQYYYVDGILMEDGATLNDYFDGSTSIGATVWTGTPHLSTSTFDLTASYYVDGGVFTAGTLQTAVDVGVGVPFGKAGVKMSTTGIQGYSGAQATPSFSLDTVGKFRVGGLSNYIYWDGTTLTVAGTLAAGVIDIGGFDSTSFHVDAGGQMWMGSATPTTAPLRISSSGDFYAKSFQLMNASQGIIATLGPDPVNPTDGFSLQFKHNDGAAPDSYMSWSTIPLSDHYVSLTNSGAQLYMSYNKTSLDSSTRLYSGYLSSQEAGVESSATSSGANVGASLFSFNGTDNRAYSYATSTTTVSNLENFVGNIAGTNSSWFQSDDGISLTFNGNHSASTGLSINSGGAATPSFSTDGTVAIGGTHLSADVKLHVSESRSAVNATIHLTHTAAGSTLTDGMSLIVTSAGIGYLRLRENNDLRLGTNNTDRMYIVSTGEVRVVSAGSVTAPAISWTGDTNTGLYRPSGDNLNIVTNGTDKIACTATGVSILLSANDGSTASVRYNGINTMMVQASNRDLKENIEEFSSATALKLVNEMKPKKFTWKPFEADTEEQAALRPLNPSVGFIAEEVAELGKEEGINFAEYRLPDDPADLADLSKWKVSYWKEPHVITLLVGAVQELTEKIKKLEKKK